MSLRLCVYLLQDEVVSHSRLSAGDDCLRRRLRHKQVSSILLLYKSLPVSVDLAKSSVTVVTLPISPT